ncbi:unnamed protein product [Mytilus edulis]|uniref:CARD domain-containing protein n=1 Tax=Mytilus edulis TaxID=6550 RepID=A0A8S3TY75_MYTED|nr:unnamed protein product [Mytilus edulis]
MPVKQKDIDVFCESHSLKYFETSAQTGYGVEACLYAAVGAGVAFKYEKNKIPFFLKMNILENARHILRPFVVEKILPVIKRTGNMEYLKDKEIHNFERFKSQLTEVQFSEDDQIPLTIWKMGKTADEQYREILQSGVENRYMIRLPVVGPFGVGKTCLTRKLLRKQISDVTSTNGIDIMTQKCRVCLTDHTWIFLKNLLIPSLKGKTNSNTTEDLAHIPDPCVSVKDDKVANTNSDDQRDQITKISPDEEMIEDEMRKTNLSTLTAVNEKYENTKKLNSKLQDNAVDPAKVEHADLFADLKGWSKSEASLDDFAEVALLDFAGQYEFYATHQAFLNKHAIYLLVIDVSKNMKGLMTCEVVDENFLDLTEIPFEDIGEYINFWMDAIHCYGDKEEEIDNTNEALPSIIVVGTCCDKLQIDKETRKWEIQKQFDEILGDHPKRKHIKDFIMLSNTTSSETDFDVLRHRIVQLASKVETWGQQLPTRWIKYEQVLDQHRENQDKVMTYQDMKCLGKSVGLEIKDMNEVNLFLRYQHDIGNLIYFDDIPDLVILQPQWLVDVLKCLVSARKFQIQRNIVYNSDWKELETTGRLTEDLITQAFRGEEEGTDFFKYRSHILQIMEKFDIIVKPNMAEEESVPALEENDVIKKSQIPTIWKWGKHSQVSFKGIWEHAEACITGIKGRYKMNVSYTVKMKCCNGSYDNANGMMEMTKLESDEEYFCDEHAVLHNSKDLLDSWFKEELNPEMLNYVRLAKSVTDLMPEMMAEHLKSDGFDFVGNTSLTSRSLFTSFQLQNTHIPTTGKWASSNCPNEDTEISIGDDVQRWRFVLTELKNHSKISEESFVALANVLANVFIRSEKKFEKYSFARTYEKIMTEMFEANDYDFYLQKVNNGKYTPSFSFLQKVNNGKYIPTFSFLQKVNNYKYILNFSFLQKVNNEIIPDTFEVNIRRHYQIIIQEISVSQILDQMMTHCSLSIDDRRHIEQHVQQIEQNKALLDIVIDRNRYTFKVFIDALRESEYDDMADLLSRDLEDVTVDTPCIRTAQMEGLSAWTVPLHKVRLQKNYVDIISTIKHEAIVDHLISSEVFTIDDQQTIEACPAQTEKNRKLMDRLLHCGEKCFIEFLNALRSDEIYADLANQIEQTDVTSIDIATLNGCYSHI